MMISKQEQVVEDGTNDYLRVNLDPEAPPVSIPDLNRKPHVLKRVYSTNAITSETQVALVFIPQAVGFTVLKGVRNVNPYNAKEVICWQEAFPYDEDLSENYVKGRLVSYGAEFYSNTVATGLAEVKGLLTAAAFNASVPWHELDPLQLTPYNSMHSVAQTPVWDGLRLLARPHPHPVYRSFKNGVSLYANAGENYEFNLDNGDSPSSVGWVPGQLTPAASIFTWSPFSDTNFPGWLRGPIKFSVSVTTLGNVGATLDSSYVLTFYRLDQTGSRVAVRSYTMYTGSTAVASRGRVSLSGAFESTFPIIEVELSVGAIMEHSGVLNFTLNVEGPDVTGSHTELPVYVMYGYSLEAAHTHSLTVVANYECVPDFTLSKEIQGVVTSRDSLRDFEYAQLALQSGALIPWMPRSRYERFREMIPALVRRASLQAGYASGFRDFFRGALTRIKPLIRSGMQIAKKTRPLWETSILAAYPEAAPYFDTALDAGFDYLEQKGYANSHTGYAAGRRISSPPGTILEEKTGYPPEPTSTVEEQYESALARNPDDLVFIPLRMIDVKFIDWALTNLSKVFLDENRKSIGLPRTFYSSNFWRLSKDKAGYASGTITLEQMREILRQNLPEEHVEEMMSRARNKVIVPVRETRSQHIPYTQLMAYAEAVKADPIKYARKFLAKPLGNTGGSLGRVQAFPIVTESKQSHMAYITMSSLPVVGKPGNVNYVHPYTSVTMYGTTIQGPSALKGDAARSAFVNAIKSSPVPIPEGTYFTVICPENINTISGPSCGAAFLALAMGMPPVCAWTGVVVEPRSTAIGPIEDLHLKENAAIASNYSYLLHGWEQGQRSVLSVYDATVTSPLVGVTSVMDFFCLVHRIDSTAREASQADQIEKSRKVAEKVRQETEQKIASGEHPSFGEFWRHEDRDDYRRNANIMPAKLERIIGGKNLSRAEMNTRSNMMSYYLVRVSGVRRKKKKKKKKVQDQGGVPVTYEVPPHTPARIAGAPIRQAPASDLKTYIQNSNTMTLNYEYLNYLYDLLQLPKDLFYRFLRVPGPSTLKGFMSSVGQLLSKYVKYNNSAYARNRAGADPPPSSGGGMRVQPERPIAPVEEKDPQEMYGPLNAGEFDEIE